MRAIIPIPLLTPVGPFPSQNPNDNSLNLPLLCSLPSSYPLSATPNPSRVSGALVDRTYVYTYTKHAKPLAARRSPRSLNTMSTPNRRSKLLAFTSRQRRPSASHQPLANDGTSSLRPSYDLARSPSPNYTDPFSSIHGHEPMTTNDNNDELLPPNRPFSTAEGGGGSGLGSRRSSSSSLKERPPSLSINYVPQKFTKLHAPGDYAHRRAKQGGGRDAFASNASRMGMPGTVDDDEGVVFQLGKGGLQKKKPKLRWNRFKWVLFACNTLVRDQSECSCPITPLTTAHGVWYRFPGRCDPRLAQCVLPIRRD